MAILIPIFDAPQIQAVAGLARDIWSEHYSPIIGAEQVEYMLDRYQSTPAIREQIDAGLLYFLLREAQEDVGYLGIELQSEAVFLSKLYVKSSRRNQGFGREAVSHVENLAREKGLPRIHLRVNKHNSDTINAYERLGFRRIGSVVDDIGNGFVMDDHVMEKRLGL